jgi:hypothetical protein
MPSQMLVHVPTVQETPESPQFELPDHHGQGRSMVQVVGIHSPDGLETVEATQIEFLTTMFMLQVPLHGASCPDDRRGQPVPVLRLRDEVPMQKQVQASAHRHRHVSRDEVAQKTAEAPQILIHC